MTLAQRTLSILAARKGLDLKYTNYIDSKRLLKTTLNALRVKRT